MECSVVPYEGKEPYLFVSYAHKDAARVYPIMEALARHDIRIWYDSGIEGGTDWIENLTEHITACSAALVFVSKNFAASRNCLNEVNHMVTKNRSIIPLMLDNFQPSDQLMFQLGNNNYIWLQNMTSMDQILETLYALQQVRQCREEYTFRAGGPDGRVPVGGTGGGRGSAAPMIPEEDDGGGTSRLPLILGIAAGVLILAALVTLGVLFFAGG